MLIFIFIICKNQREAEKIGLALLKKRLAGCVVVIPKVYSAYFWPPKKNRIEKTEETILVVKTFEKKFLEVEREVRRLHSYSVPFIAGVRALKVNKSYLNWLRWEIK